ncbi:MAG: GNAT family N-acetyltransferase [Bacteroidota bacterium]
MKLRTNRLLLREIEDKDLENVFKGLSNPKVTKYYGVRFDTLEATKKQMVWFADKQQMWWAICSPNNQVFYGAGGLSDINHESKTAEIGLWLLPAFWGKGFMKEALTCISNYGIHQLKLSRIEGFVDTENRQCKKAMSKLDFKHEKTMKDCDLKNGKSISIDFYVKAI